MKHLIPFLDLQLFLAMRLLCDWQLWVQVGVLVAAGYIGVTIIKRERKHDRIN